MLKIFSIKSLKHTELTNSYPNNNHSFNKILKTLPIHSHTHKMIQNLTLWISMCKSQKYKLKRIFGNEVRKKSVLN